MDETRRRGKGRPGVDVGMHRGVGRFGVGADVRSESLSLPGSEHVVGRARGAPGGPLVPRSGETTGGQAGPPEGEVQRLPHPTAADALCPHRPRDGSWWPRLRIARTGGDVQLLLPRAQGANPGERGHPGHPRPRRGSGRVGALRGDRRRPGRGVRARAGLEPGRVKVGVWGRPREVGRDCEVPREGG